MGAVKSMMLASMDQTEYDRTSPLCDVSREELVSTQYATLVRFTLANVLLFGQMGELDPQVSTSRWGRERERT